MEKKGGKRKLLDLKILKHIKSKQFCLDTDSNKSTVKIKKNYKTNLENLNIY